MIRVELDERSYDVTIARGALSSLGEITRNAVATSPRPRAFLACDENLPRALVGCARASLESAGFVVASAEMRAIEANKTLESTGALLRAMMDFRLERTDPVVALGGGIVGDVAGFAAATYRRGVPLIQCPTTLLAMVDASVGGKTGVNGVHQDGRLAKNAFGAFHQPRAVIIDPGVLDSLPERHFRAGLAECVKHAMLGDAFGDPGLFEWTEANASSIRARDARVLIALIARSVALKARVVALDEREASEDPTQTRALLNLGHTFGHALEVLDGVSPDGDLRHSPLLHGEAVALGLLAATRCAESLGLGHSGYSTRVEKLLRVLSLPVGAHGMPGTPEVLRFMGEDKKTRGSQLRLVLPTDVGFCRVVEAPDLTAVAKAIEGLRMGAHLS